MAVRRTLVALALLAAACGKRGDPRPPVPVIPQATSDLVVTQRADKVILSWSYPALTTAGRSLTEVRRISIFRYVEELPAPAGGRDPNAILPGDIDPTRPQPVALFAKIPTLPEAQFTKLSHRIDSIEKANLPAATSGAKLLFADTPPFRSTDGRPVRLTYAVVTEGATARSQPSNLAIIVPLAVAVRPANLAASAKAEGVTLTWTAPTQSVTRDNAPIVAGYNVFRTKPGEELPELAAPLNPSLITATTYTDAPPYGEHEYRVSAVAATGPPLVQSDPSAPARVTFKDLVAPPAPTSITPLVETKAIRLIWEPVEAADLAGYKLYRSEGMGHGADVKDIGTIPLEGGAIVTTAGYVDTRANLGIAYKYAVTAVDKNGNESARVWTGWVVAPKTP
ncbi:MAG TPA: hypothetical protein VF824_16380 [Thermoanaerobaculia bacterium]|jgi:hypothetical protein